ncbi:MAG: hypothetical protein ABI881_08565 [Betaproteobacteria bacterium]
MNCTICGFDNPADGRFCKKCGAALVAPVGTAPGVAPVQAAIAPASADALAGVAASPSTGIPKPYIVIAVVALVILVGAWVAWRAVGGNSQVGDELATTNSATPAESKSETPPPAADATTSSTPAPTLAAATSPPTPPADNAAATPDTDASPAPDVAKAAPKAAHKAAAKARPQPAAPLPSTAIAPAPEPRAAAAPAAKAAPRADRWAQMANEMNACAGNFLERVVCEQKVRIHYCDGYWGKVPQCPTGPAPTTGG